MLVGGEIAMALFLLTGSCLIIRGIYTLEHQKLGFRLDHLLTASVALDHARYGDTQQQLKFIEALTSRLQRIAGVEKVAAASNLPATGGDRVSIRVEGEPVVARGEQRNALNIVVTPDYFATAAVPLMRGRAFTDTDDSKGPRVAVVNQEFARRFFGSQDAIGKRILIEGEGTTPAWTEVVGVASDVKAFSEETRVDPQVYRPVRQNAVASFSLMLRTNMDPNSLIPDLRHAVTELDPELPLLSVMNMDGVIESQRGGDPVFTKMLAIFAALALILATIGVYGLIAYSVSQRAQEVGIRLALGARRSDISWMILREGLIVAGIGSAIGLASATSLPTLFDSMFVGLHFGGPAIYPVVLAVILIMAILATLVPARRAARIDPMAALRTE